MSALEKEQAALQALSLKLDLLRVQAEGKGPEPLRKVESVMHVVADALRHALLLADAAVSASAEKMQAVPMEKKLAAKHPFSAVLGLLRREWTKAFSEHGHEQTQTFRIFKILAEHCDEIVPLAKIAKDMGVTEQKVRSAFQNLRASFDRNHVSTLVLQWRFPGDRGGTADGCGLFLKQE